MKIFDFMTCLLLLCQQCSDVTSYIYNGPTNIVVMNIYTDKHIHEYIIYEVQASKTGH